MPTIRRSRVSLAMAAAMATMALPIEAELVVDLFAGGGGASEGIAAGYREPDVAINHSAAAIVAHTANHPTTVHYQSDVFEVCPLAATGGRPVAVLWASPDCRHFSKAKGAAPRSPRVRALAWVAVRWAFLCRPRLLCLENVEEFQDWGPLDDAGKPIADRRGETYRAFIAVLTTGLDADHPAMAEIREYLGEDVPVAALVRGLGYNVEARQIRACDHGTPTIRKRLFVVGCANGARVVWPEPTHGKPGSAGVIAGRLLPYRTAAECIDWSIPTPSLWAAGRRLCKPNTLRRCVKGLLRHVIDSPRPYIVPLRGTSAAHTSTHGVDEPAATVSASGTHHALVAPHLMHLTHHGERPGTAPGDQMPTITSAPRGEQALCTPILMTTAHSTSTGRGPAAWPLDESMRTIDSSGAGLALTAPVLIEAAHSDESASGAKRWGSGVKDLQEPAGTVHAGGGNFAITAANLVAFGQNAVGGNPDDPLQTVLAGAARHGVLAAHLQPQYGRSDAAEAGAPLGAVTTRGKTALVAAHLEQANGGFYDGDGRAVDAPVSTITSSGTQQRLVTAHLIQYYSSGGQDAPAGEPMRTIPTKGRIAVVQTVAIAADLLTEDQWRTARLAAALLREYAPERFPCVAGTEQPEIVLIGGYILVDIGLRMLKPRELARAQGFRDSYILDPEITVTNARGKVVTRRLTATEQVRLIGNSVCPQVAEAITRANLLPLINTYRRAVGAA